MPDAALRTPLLAAVSEDLVSEVVDVVRRPSRRGAAVVASFLPYLEDPTNVRYTVANEPLALDPFAYSEEVHAWVQALYETGFVQSLDWPAWAEEAARYEHRPELVGSADVKTLVRLLTTHVRRDRFVAGHLARVLDDGTIVAILHRVRELYRIPGVRPFGGERDGAHCPTRVAGLIGPALTLACGLDPAVSLSVNGGRLKQGK